MNLKTLSNKNKILAGSAVGIAALTILFFLFSKKSDAPTYQSVTVERGGISVSINATGTVQPENRLEIKPPVAGRIEEVKVKEGEVISQGTILALMSSTERAALLDSARARGDAELKRWQEFYKATPIYAPIDGSLINRAIEPGQTVTNQDAILVMADRLSVKAQVDETDLAQIKLEQAAEIILDAYPDKPLEGKVSHIAYEATVINNVTNYYVDVLPHDPPDFLRSGMTATVDFKVKEANGILVVPAQAVKTENGASFVLAGTKRKKEKKPVQTGITDGSRVEIASGLQEGETIWMEEFKSQGASRGGQSPFSPSRGPRGPR